MSVFENEMRCDCCSDVYQALHGYETILINAVRQEEIRGKFESNQ